MFKNKLNLIKVLKIIFYAWTGVLNIGILIVISQHELEKRNKIDISYKLKFLVNDMFFMLLSFILITNFNINPLINIMITLIIMLLIILFNYRLLEK